MSGLVGVGRLVNQGNVVIGWVSIGGWLRVGEGGRDGALACRVVESYGCRIVNGWVCGDRQAVSGWWLCCG